MRIIVLGYIIRGPLGGLAWHHLQYVMGLARLGHDVYFLEDSHDYPSCYDPTSNETTTDPGYGLAFAAHVFTRMGLGDRWVYYDAHREQWHGPCADRVHGILSDVEVLLNVSGVNPLRPWLVEIPNRVLIDTDPVFTQVRHLTQPQARLSAAAHTAFVSFAENIGRPDCGVPGDGFSWQPTRQPIVLDAWTPTPGKAGGRFTTVMQWESYPACHYGGIRYGMKSDSFEAYLMLPQHAGSVFELAIGSAPAGPRTLLERNGWRLRDPLTTIPEPWAYQRFIEASKAEFSVAKHGYVVSRSGWFSERSASYLASGRPVVTQETGFSDHVASGAGLIPFTTPAEALAAIDDINTRYEFHCGAARAVAESYFDARIVLMELLERVMNGSPAGKSS